MHAIRDGRVALRNHLPHGIDGAPHRRDFLRYDRLPCGSVRPSPDQKWTFISSQ